MSATRDSYQRRFGIVSLMITIVGFGLGFVMTMAVKPSWFMNVILLILDHPPVTIALALSSLAGACLIIVRIGRYFRNC
jgi:hypothetical protein